MFFSKQEMLILCAFHRGTLSATLELMRIAEGDDPERMATIKSVAEKLESIAEGGSISLQFDPEN